MGPYTRRHPATPALDLLRLAVLHPSVPEAYAEQPSKLVDAIVHCSQLNDTDPSGPAEVNRMMGARALANLCCTRPGRAILTSTLASVRMGRASLPVPVVHSN